MVTKGSVLVVDDEINLCRILGAKLAKSGYNVVAVHDGLQAVEKVRESDFDVVLLDLILPKMDGLTALAEIRGMRNALPVIVMTACESAEALEQARAHGVSAYVNKPFDLDNLVSLVQCTSRDTAANHCKRLPESTVLFTKGHPVTLEIQNGGGTKTYISHIADRDDCTLSVASPYYEGCALEVAPRTTIRVGIAARDAYYSFTTHVLRCTVGSESLIVLDKPCVIYRTQRRQQQRFPVSIPIRYGSLSNDDETVSTQKQGKTMDLGLGGACIVVPDAMLPGELLKVELRPKTTKDIISVTAQVLRAKRAENQGESGHIVGCKFISTDEKLRKLIEG